MKKKNYSKLNKQGGYGLIEIILGLALMGILGTGLSTFAFQTMSVTDQSKDRMHATMQANNAGSWLSRDIQMSGNVTLGGNAGFPLELQWKDTELNGYQVTYTLSEGAISRTLVKNGTDTVQTLVAQNINPDTLLTNVSSSDGLITFNVTATSGTIDMSRTYTIKQRLDLKD